jgi:hypothetical protein
MTVSVPAAPEVEVVEGAEPEPKEIDWKAEARKHEQRAKDNAAKAKANESAAQRLAEIEDANKSEIEKIVARAEAAEKRAAELEAKSIRSEVALAKGVPASLLTGSTQEELEASADALIEFRGEKAADRLTVPNEGKSPTKAGGSDEREFADFLTGRNN